MCKRGGSARRFEPFQGTRDGRASYLALMDQQKWKDKWVVILIYIKSYVSERKWNGTTSHTLQSHVEQCRAAYVEIKTTSQNVTEKILNQRTRVKNFLNYVEGCTYPKVCAHVAVVSNEINGMSDNFELAVAHLLPAWPVADKIGSNRKNYQISTLGGDLTSGTGPRNGV